MHTRREFLQHCAPWLPGTMLHFNLADAKRLNCHFGHQAVDQAIDSVSRMLDRLVGQAGLCARISGDEWAALLPGAFLEPVNALLRDFRRDVRLDIGWKSFGTRDGVQATAQETTPSCVTWALRCLYAPVSSPAEVMETLELLAEENHGDVPSDASPLSARSGATGIGWCCVSSYPAIDPYCPFCRGAVFDWVDGDTTVYGGSGICQSCGAHVDIRGVELVA